MLFRSSRITRGQFRGVSEAKLLELVTRLGYPSNRRRRSNSSTSGRCASVFRWRCGCANSRCFNLGIDSKLRGCDLVALKVRDVCHGDQVATRDIVMQHKTQRPVQFEITQATRDALHACIKEAGLKPEDFLFPSRLHDCTGVREAASTSSPSLAVRVPTCGPKPLRGLAACGSKVPLRPQPSPASGSNAGSISPVFGGDGWG